MSPKSKTAGRPPAVSQQCAYIAAMRLDYSMEFGRMSSAAQCRRLAC